MINMSPTTEKSYGLKVVLPSLSILVLMIIMVLPYKSSLISDIMPFLTLIGVYYWSVFKPRMLPVVVVFILGVLQDILLGSPIGLMPLLLIVVQPYICGSSYFMKMMDFKKGEWCNTMDGLYWRFIDRNRKFFLKNPRLSMMVYVFDKMKYERKKMILSEADKFIKLNTN